MKRGDFVTVAMRGDFGKPRPAPVIQADQFDENASLAVLPVTSALLAAPLLRIAVQPSAANGLQQPSPVMVDKAMTMTVKRDKVGRASDASMRMRWWSLSAGWLCSWALPGRACRRTRNGLDHFGLSAISRCGESKGET